MLDTSPADRVPASDSPGSGAAPDQVYDAILSWTGSQLPDCVRLHRLVLAAYGPVPAPARASLGLLYAYEPARRVVFVQSVATPVRPWPSLLRLVIASTDTLSATAGSRWVFRLHAHPTVSRFRDPLVRGRRTSLLDPAAAAAWLERQASAAGFVLERVVVEPAMWYAGNHKAGRVRLAITPFAGVLRVTDPAAFARARRNGLGHGKAFGAGLLRVARCSSTWQP